MCEQLEGKVVYCPGSQTPAESLATDCQSSLHTRSFHPVRPSEDLCGGWHPAKDPILSGLPQPPVPCPLWSRALIDCKPLPLESGSARKAAASLPQLLPFFITIFSAFHFLGQEEAQGAHLFLSSRSSVPRRIIILLLMCAHVPHWTTKTPWMAKEIRTGSE